MANDDTTGDNVYKWTIRSLYPAVIFLNLWYMVNQYKDTPEGQAMANQTNKFYKRLRHPFDESKRFRKMATETIVEAWTVVDEAKKDSEPNE